MKSKQSSLQRNPDLIKFLTLCFGPAIAGMTLQSAHATSATWDGGAATNVLNTPANWTSETTLPATALDTATWDGTVAGDLSLVWNAAFGPTSGNLGGVNLDLAATQTAAVQLDATSAGVFGLGDITIASEAGAFTLGDGAGTSNVTFRDPTAAFTNHSAKTATLKSDLVFGNGGGAGSRLLTFDGTGNWLVEGTLVSATTFTNAASALLTKNGTGTLALNAANSHGGTTTINGGILDANATAALGTGTVKMPNGGGRLRISGGSTLTNAIEIPGRMNSADSQPKYSSIENVSGENFISGNVTWNATGGNFNTILATAGTLTLSGTLTTTLTTGPRTFHFTGAGNILVSGNILDGASTPLGVAKGGAGTLTLSGTNSYTLGTTISGGILALGGIEAIGSAGPLVFSGGTLQYSAANTTDYSDRIASGVSTGVIIIDTNGQNVAFASNFTADQSGGLAKRGAGTLTLSGTNSHSGTTTIAAGSLEAQNSNALSTGDVTIPNGGGKLLLSNNIDLTNAVSISGQSNTPNSTSGRIENVSGTNSISGNITYGDVGGLTATILSTTGTLTLSGNLTTTLLSGPRIFHFAGAGDIAVSGEISDGTSAVVGVSKAGAGTLTLSGPTTYTGNTTVDAGALVVSNNSATTFADTSTVTITSGAVLHLPNAATDTVGSLVLNGVAQPGGLYDSSTPGNFITGSGKIQVVALAGFASWASANGAAGQTAAQDHDSDGVNNGIEYFLGQNGSGFTALPVPDSTGKVSWTKSPDYRGTFEVQTSADLSVWIPVSHTVSGNQVEYTLPPGQGRLFVRLIVNPN